MPELETQPDPKDPLTHLHKMSTTAGVGSAEYVAINNFAVIAAVLGAASLLSLLTLLLLIIPAAAVICGIVAVHQVRNSNGTQGGRLLAWGGIALAVLVSVSVGVRSWLGAAERQVEQAKINTVIAQLGDHLRDNKFEEAYGLFDAFYHERVTLTQMSDVWRTIADPRAVASLVSMEGNNRFQWATDRRAQTMVIITFTRPDGTTDTSRNGIELVRNSSGQWQIRNFAVLPLPSEQGQAQDPMQEDPDDGLPSGPLGPAGPPLPD